MTIQQTIAFIGGGQMAAAMCRGLLASGHKAAQLRIAEPDAARADWLRSEFGVTVKPAAAEVVAGAAIVVLAVKPQVMPQALTGLNLAAGTLVISIAAGVRLESLQKRLGAGIHPVRCMPNTPVHVRAGITVLFTPAATPAAARAQAEDVMNTVGETLWVRSEEQLDAVTALSGSGPAYYYLLTEALRDAGTALGLDAGVAARLARHTFVGSALLLNSGQDDVVRLRANVTSKGGTTEAAVAHLESGGLRRLFKDALAAAHRRARELGDSLAAQT